MLDYKAIIQFRRSGLSLNEIASRLQCKWDSVQRVIVRCENYWGSLDGVPEDFTNEQIADAIFKARKSIDPDYLQPDAERILERQRQVFLRSELWAEYCAEAAAAGKKAYGLSRFNEIVSEYKAQHDISFTVNHTPGLDAQADWAGDLFNSANQPYKTAARLFRQRCASRRPAFLFCSNVPSVPALWQW